MTQLVPSIALALLGVGVVVVLWGLLSPVRSLPAWSHRHDKLLHALAFAVFAVLASLGWSEVSPWELWLALTLAGLASEGLQHLTPDRRFCWRDAVANAMGAVEKPIVHRVDKFASMRGLRLVADFNAHPLSAQTYEAEIGFGVWGRTSAAILDGGHQTTYENPSGLVRTR